MDQYKTYFFGVGIDPFVDTREQPAYNTREFTLDTKFVPRFERLYDIYGHKTQGVPEDVKLILNSFYSTYGVQMGNVRRYDYLYNSICYDELNYLELCGLATYSKRYQLVFDLSQQVDLILAFLLNEDYLQIRASIFAACEKHCVSYRLFSRALTTAEPDLVRGIPLALVYDISPALSEYLRKLLANRQRLNNSSIFNHVDISSASDAQVLQVLLQMHVFLVEQYMLNQILEQYGKYRTTSAESLVVTSKGLYNIIIQSYTSRINFEPIIPMGSIGNVCISPYIVERGFYFRVLGMDDVKKVAIV